VGAYLFIHGGVHDSSCWDPVLGPLRELGHDVRAIDLPGRGPTADLAASTTLEDYISCASTAVDAFPEPPILVAHSIGGATASALAERRPDAVRGIVYVSAVVPMNGAAGLPTLQEIGSDCALLQEGAITFADDFTTVTVRPDSARSGFYNRCSEGVAKRAVTRLTPEPVQPLMTPVMLGDNFASVPKTYIGATHDTTVPPDFQRTLAERCGATFLPINSDHSPFYSATEELVALLSDEDRRWRR
jgi:pimeloyl-ACP methyl ester carboxylesterase